MMRSMRATVAAVLFAGLAVAAAACSSANSTTMDPTADAPAPQLTIDTPTRGTTVDGSTVTVSGSVVASGAVHVTVNGTDTPVGSDGSFSTSVTLTDGIDVIETHAIDTAGNDVRDTRAVLAGTLAATDGSMPAPIGTHASAGVLTKIGGTMAADAKAIDYTTVAQGLNPIYDNGGCLGAQVNITSVAIGDVTVGLKPTSNALAATVTASNVKVVASVSYKVACIGGSGTITVTSSAAHVTGNLGVSVASGKIATTLPSTSVTLDDFDISVGGIPSEVTDLFNSIVKGKVQTALGNAIQSKVPAIANSKLAGLLAKPFDVKILGNETTLAITPTEAKIDATGMYVGVDTSLVVANGTGGMFLTETTADAQTLMSQTQNLGFAIANDCVNQLLSGLWAAGAFDQTVSISSIPVLSAVLDSNATQLKLSLSLPPTVATDASGNLKLSIGDAMISVQDAAGTELQKIALSLSTAAAVAGTPSGTLTMALDTPTVYAQVLTQTDDGSLVLSDTQVQGLVTGAWSLLSAQASTALAKLPLPSIEGVQLGDPTVNSVSNYVLADIPLQ
jgi:hypothetical protein